MTPAELKTLREACGLSLPQLAALSDVQERTARYWEAGHSVVPADVADFVQRLDANLTLAANQGVHAVADHAAAHPGKVLADVVLVRYRTDADLHRFRKDMIGLPASAHAAILYRTRKELEAVGVACRIVYLDVDDYLAWLAGRKDGEATRAAWAGLQIPQEAAP